MNKSYWTVRREGHRMMITCPECDEWYDIPNFIAELKCYRHCPWCGNPMFIREEDKIDSGKERVD